MPIQITLRILNLNEGKFAAPWAITIEKEKKTLFIHKKAVSLIFSTYQFFFFKKDYQAHVWMVGKLNRARGNLLPNLETWKFKKQHFQKFCF